MKSHEDSLSSKHCNKGNWMRPRRGIRVRNTCSALCLRGSQWRAYFRDAMYCSLLLKEQVISQLKA